MMVTQLGILPGVSEGIPMRAFEIFSKMYDWLPGETIEGLKAVVLHEASADEFAAKVGPANYDYWSRDIRVICETLEILGMEKQQETVG